MLLETKIDASFCHADIYYLAGEARRLLIDFEIAEEHFLNCLSMNLHTPFVYYSLGLIYSHYENYSRAIPLLTQFL